MSSLLQLWTDLMSSLLHLWTDLLHNNTNNISFISHPKMQANSETHAFVAFTWLSWKKTGLQQTFNATKWQRAVDPKNCSFLFSGSTEQKATVTVLRPSAGENELSMSRRAKTSSTRDWSHMHTEVCKVLRGKPMRRRECKQTGLKCNVLEVG